MLFALLIGYKCKVFGLFVFFNKASSFLHPCSSARFLGQRYGSKVKCTMMASMPNDMEPKSMPSLMVYNFMSQVEYGHALNIQKQIQAELIQNKMSGRSEVAPYFVTLSLEYY